MAEMCTETTRSGKRCERKTSDWRCYQHRNGHLLSDREALALIDNHASPVDLMRMADPGLTDDAADFVLWELTPFPLIQGVHDLLDYAEEHYDHMFAHLAARDQFKDRSRVQAALRWANPTPVRPVRDAGDEEGT